MTPSPLPRDDRTPKSIASDYWSIVSFCMYLVAHVDALWLVVQDGGAVVCGWR